MSKKVWFVLPEETSLDCLDSSESRLVPVTELTESLDPLDEFSFTISDRHRLSASTQLSQYSCEVSRSPSLAHQSRCGSCLCASSPCWVVMDPNTNETISTNDSPDVSSSGPETTATSDGNFSLSHYAIDEGEASSSVQDSGQDEVVHSAIMEVSGELLLGKFSPHKYHSSGSESSDISDDDKHGQHGGAGGAIVKYPESSTGLSDNDWNPYATESDTNQTPRSEAGEDPKVRVPEPYKPVRDTVATVDMPAGIESMKMSAYEPARPAVVPESGRGEGLAGPVDLQLMDGGAGMASRPSEMPSSTALLSKETGGEQRLDMLRYVINEGQKREATHEERLKEFDDDEIRNSADSDRTAKSECSTRSDEDGSRRASSESSQSFKSELSQASQRNVDAKRESVESTHSLRSNASTHSGKEHRRVSTESGLSLRTEDTGSTCRSGRPSTESGISPRFDLERSDTTDPRRESAESAHSIRSDRSDRSHRSSGLVENHRLSTESERSLRSERSEQTETSDDARRHSGESAGSLQSDRSERLDRLDASGKAIQELMQSEAAQRELSAHSSRESDRSVRLSKEAGDPGRQNGLTGGLMPYSNSYSSDRSPSNVKLDEYVSVNERERLLVDSPERDSPLRTRLPDPPRQFGLPHKPEVVFDRSRTSDSQPSGENYTDASYRTGRESDGVGLRSPSDVSMKRVAQLFEATKNQVRQAVSLPRPEPSGSEERFPLRERLSMSQHGDDSFRSQGRADYSQTAERSDSRLEKSRESETRSITSEEVARVLGKPEHESRRTYLSLEADEDDKDISPVRVSAFDRVNGYSNGSSHVTARGDNHSPRDRADSEKTPPVTEMSDDEIARRVRAILTDTSHLGMGSSGDMGKLPVVGSHGDAANGYSAKAMDYVRLEQDLQEIQDSLNGTEIPPPKANDSLHFQMKHLRSKQDQSSISDQDTYKSSVTTSGETESGRGRRLLWDHGADFGYNDDYTGQFQGTMTETDTLSQGLKRTTDSDNLVVRPDSTTTNETENDVPEIDSETLTASGTDALLDRVLKRQAEGNLRENVEDIIAKYRNERRDLFERFQPENDGLPDKVYKIPGNDETLQPQKPDNGLQSEQRDGQAAVNGLSQRVSQLLTEDPQPYKEPSPTAQNGMAKQVFKLLSEDRPDQQVNGILTDALEQEHQLLKKLAEQPRVDSSYEEFSLDSTANSFAVHEEDLRKQLHWSQMSSPEKTDKTGLSQADKTGMSDFDNIRKMTSAPYTAFNTAKTFLSSQLQKMSQQTFDKSVELRTPYRQVVDCYPVYGVEKDKDGEPTQREVKDAWGPDKRTEQQKEKDERAARSDALASERFFLTDKDGTPQRGKFYRLEESPERHRTYSDPFELSPARKYSTDREHRSRSKSEEAGNVSDLSQYSVTEFTGPGTDRRAAMSPRKMRRLEDEDVDLARRQRADFMSPKKASDEFVQDWSCDRYTSHSDASDKNSHSDSSDYVPASNQWRYYGYQLYDGDSDLYRARQGPSSGTRPQNLASPPVSQGNKRLSRSLETERVDTIVDKYGSKQSQHPRAAPPEPGAGAERWSKSLGYEQRGQQGFDLELERKVLAHESGAFSAALDSYYTNERQLRELLMYDRHRYNVPMDLPVIEPGQGLFDKPMELPVIPPKERPSRSRERRVRGRVLNDKEARKQTSPGSAASPARKGQSKRKLTPGGQGGLTGTQPAQTGSRETGGAGKSSNSAPDTGEKQGAIPKQNQIHVADDTVRAQKVPLNSSQKETKIIRGHMRHYGNTNHSANKSQGRHKYPSRESSSSPPESDTSASKLSRLRPYRPVGSQYVYYTESGDETNDSGTTVESTHAGSDDAVPPYIPSQYMGSRLEEPGKHPIGIYGNRDALSTIDEKSNVDEKERAVSEVASRESGQTSQPAELTTGDVSRNAAGSDSGVGSSKDAGLTDTRHGTTEPAPRTQYSARPREAGPHRPESYQQDGVQPRPRSPFSGQFSNRTAVPRASDRPRSRSPYMDGQNDNQEIFRGEVQIQRTRSPYTEKYPERSSATELDRPRSRSPYQERRSAELERQPGHYRDLVEREEMLQGEIRSVRERMEPRTGSQRPNLGAGDVRRDLTPDDLSSKRGTAGHAPHRYSDEKLASLGASVRSDPGGREEDADDLAGFQRLPPEPMYPQERLRYSRSKSDTNLIDMSPSDSQKYSSPMVPGTRFLELSTQPSPIFHHDSAMSLPDHPHPHHQDLGLGLPRPNVGPVVERTVKEMLRDQRYPLELPHVPDHRPAATLPRVDDRAPRRDEAVRRSRSPQNAARNEGRQMDSGADPTLGQSRTEMRATRRSPVARPGSGQDKSPLHVREKEMEQGLEELKKELDAQLNPGKTPPVTHGTEEEFEDSFPPSKKAQVLREVLEQDYQENIPPNINDMWRRFQEINQDRSESSLDSTRMGKLEELLKNPTHHAVGSFLAEKKEDSERRNKIEQQKMLMLKQARHEEMEREKKLAEERALEERNLRRMELRQKHGLSEEESNGSYSEFVVEKEREKKKREKTRKTVRSEGKDRTPSPSKCKTSQLKTRREAETQGKEQKVSKKSEDLRSLKQLVESQHSDTQETLFSIPEDASFEASPGKTMSELKARQKRHRHVIDPLMKKLRDKIKVQRDKIDKERRKELQRVEKLKKLEMLLTAKRKGKLSDKAIDVELDNCSLVSGSQSESSALLTDTTGTLVGSTTLESSTASQDSTTIKDSSAEPPQLQVKRYPGFQPDRLSPKKKVLMVHDLETTEESSDFSNIVVERLPAAKPTRKSSERKSSSKKTKTKVDEFGNKIRREKKKEGRGIDFGENVSEEELARQIRKYRKMRSPERNQRDVGTMYPSPIVVSPPSRRRTREVYMKSEAIQTTPSIRSASPSHSYDEVPVAPVPLMLNEPRKSSRSPRRVSPAVRKSSPAGGKRPSPSPPRRRTEKTRPVGQLPPTEERVPPPKSSMFTPETPDENQAPHDPNKFQGTSWFVPLKPSQPWRKPLKERQALSVQQEPWEPQSVSQSTWKNIVHGDVLAEQKDAMDVSSNTKFDLDPEGQVKKDEDTQSGSEESDLDVSRSKPLSKMTLQEAFLQKRQDMVSRSRERQKRLTLAGEERRMQAYLQLERDRLFQEQKKKEANPEAHPYSDNLFRPARRTLSKEEMKELTERKYKKLPEVVEREKQKKKTEEYSLNRLKARLYNRKVQKKVLQHAQVWGR